MEYEIPYLKFFFFSSFNAHSHKGNINTRYADMWENCLLSIIDEKRYFKFHRSLISCKWKKKLKQNFSCHHKIRSGDIRVKKKTFSTRVIWILPFLCCVKWTEKIFKKKSFRRNEAKWLTTNFWKSFKTLIPLHFCFIINRKKTTFMHRSKSL